MRYSRREALALGGAAAVVTALPMPAFADLTEDAIAAFTGGAEVGAGGIELTAPEIAENGNTVPIEVSAPGATSIMVLAAGNPNPAVPQVGKCWRGDYNQDADLSQDGERPAQGWRRECHSAFDHQPVYL